MVDKIFSDRKYRGKIVLYVVLRFLRVDIVDSVFFNRVFLLEIALAVLELPL